MALSFLTGSRVLLFRRCLSSCPSTKQWWWTRARNGARVSLFSTTIARSNNTPHEKTSPKTLLSALKEHLYTDFKDRKQLFNSDSEIESLVQATSKELHLYTVHELLSLLNCLTKVKFQPPQLLERLIASLIQHSSKLTLSEASSVVQIYRKLSLKSKADELSQLFSDKLLRTLTKGDYLHPWTVVNLSDCQTWTPDLVTAVQNYALAHSERFSFQSIMELLTLMLRKNATTYTVRHKCADVAKILIDSLPKSIASYNEIGKLFWVYGKCTHHHGGLFETLEKVLQVEDRHLSPFCVTTLAWSCARVRYYNPDLMEFIAHYSLRNLNSFTFHDLSNLVYTFGYLNHPHRELFAAVTERFVRTEGTRNTEQAHWVFVWACMVLGVYDTRVLSKVLNSEFIEASTQKPGYKVQQPLQMSIALNYERPDLGLGDPNPPPSHKWGVCFSRMKGVNSKYIQQATVLRLESYQARDRSRTFVDNVNRALGTILGGPQFVNREVVSLSGYVIDFEVILNERNEPIIVPREWIARQKHSVVLKSIGVASGGNGSSTSYKLDTSSLIEIAKQSELKGNGVTGQDNRRPSNHKLDTSSLIELTKQSESSSKGSSILSDLLQLIDNTSQPQARDNGEQTSSYKEDHTIPFSSSSSATIDSVELVNLASDWGSKFTSPKEKVARRLAIEADGLPHFASNCDHVMGPTVLKHKQLRALGWEVVQIPYLEWKSLVSGDDHAQYLSEKIFSSN